MVITTRISDIRYNPADRAFEAMVTLVDKGQAYSYPVSLPGALDRDCDEVSRTLTTIAKRRHDRNAPVLRSIHPNDEALPHETIPAMVQQATQALWERIMGRAA
ncbi:hypothetical protein [Pseudooceanicola algae]|uniref:Uncharacterized protein n=1 Tax=Pseudooceanicola algae TaxID=1537215 RepID=A0A418SIW4_9RHOB|nr:hypothetical protein [Pseudooceanicola algae]QPM91827.1 hypothetical protein PSAL_030830 [Pseudooceanicola algae]